MLSKPFYLHFVPLLVSKPQATTSKRREKKRIISIFFARRELSPLRCALIILLFMLVERKLLQRRAKLIRVVELAPINRA